PGRVRRQARRPGLHASCCRAAKLRHAAGHLPDAGSCSPAFRRKTSRRPSRPVVPGLLHKSSGFLAEGEANDETHCWEIETPQGSSPTWTVFTTFRLATSMTETSFDRPLVVRRYFSSGVNAMCQTLWPTRRYFLTSCVAASITATRLAGPSATNAVFPSRVIAIPTA